MKIRKCHVTNSSSSSFVCEICGRSESGWDFGLSDVGMCECVNGHVFCEDEQLEVDKDELVKFIIENEYNLAENNYSIKKDLTEEELKEKDDWELVSLCTDDSTGCYGVPECVCPICQFIEYSEFDLSKYLLKKYEISRDEVFAEVKKLNKRRRKLYENEYITYVCKKFDLNPTEIVAGWKEEFKTYEAFSKWLNSK